MLNSIMIDTNDSGSHYLNQSLSNSINNIWNNVFLIIDSGHGWDTAGKRSPDGLLRENEFNTAIEDKLSFLLSMYNIRYGLLASGWKDESLGRRVAIENTLHSKAKKHGLIPLGISIHANAYPPDERVRGVETYYFSNSRMGKPLAQYVQDGIVNRYKTDGYGDIPNRGIKHNTRFTMTKRTKSYFCLIEAAVMTNPIDKQYLLSDEFRNTVTLGIFEGLTNFLLNHKKDLM